GWLRWDYITDSEPDRARQLLEEAADIFDQLGDDTGAAEAHARLVLTRPDPGELEPLRVTLDEQRRAGRKGPLAELLAAAAIVALVNRDSRAVLAFSEEGAGLRLEDSTPAQRDAQSLLRGCAAFISWHLGDGERGRMVLIGLLEDSLALHQYRWALDAYEPLCVYALDHPAETALHAEAALAIAVRHGLPGHEAWALVMKAVANVEAGDWEAARQGLGMSEAILARRPGAQGAARWAALARGELLLGAGQVQEATEAF